MGSPAGGSQPPVEHMLHSFGGERGACVDMQIVLVPSHSSGNGRYDAAVQSGLLSGQNFVSKLATWLIRLT